MAGQCGTEICTFTVLFVLNRNDSAYLLQRLRLISADAECEQILHLPISYFVFDTAIGSGTFGVTLQFDASIPHSSL